MNVCTLTRTLETRYVFGHVLNAQTTPHPSGRTTLIQTTCTCIVKPSKIRGDGRKCASGQEARRVEQRKLQTRPGMHGSKNAHAPGAIHSTKFLNQLIPWWQCAVRATTRYILIDYSTAHQGYDCDVRLHRWRHPTTPPRYDVADLMLPVSAYLL